MTSLEPLVRELCDTNAEDLGAKASLYACSAGAGELEQEADQGGAERDGVDSAEVLGVSG